MKDKLRQVKFDQAKLATMYRNIFNSPDGKKVLADLEKYFGGSSIRKVDGRVDHSASLLAIGSREVLLHINYMRKHNAVDG